jgi:hypothetical protein
MRDSLLSMKSYDEKLSEQLSFRLGASLYGLVEIFRRGEQEKREEVRSPPLWWRGGLQSAGEICQAGYSPSTPRLLAG